MIAAAYTPLFDPTLGGYVEGGEERREGHTSCPNLMIRRHHYLLHGLTQKWRRHRALRCTSHILPFLCPMHSISLLSKEKKGNTERRDATKGRARGRSGVKEINGYLKGAVITGTKKELLILATKPSNVIDPSHCRYSLLCRTCFVCYMFDVIE